MRLRTKIAINTVLALYTAILVIPILWMFLTAFKTPTDLFKNKLGLPVVWHFENFVAASRIAKIPLYFVNTIFLAAIVICVGVALSSAVAFVLSRFQFRGRAVLLTFFIAGWMVPMHAVIIPIYEMAISLHTLDSLLYLGLVFAGFNVPMSVLVLSSFMSQLPNELEESAIMDGAGVWMIFLRITVPLSRDGIISMMILGGLGAWNDLLLPLILLSRESIKTISVGMMSFFAQYTTEPTLLLAAAFIAMLPVLVFYALLQEKVIQGMTVGALKG